LTLIELVVVLVVLIALAGILVVQLPNMLGRAHTSSGATNIGEVTKFVQIYEQLYQSHPTDLDALGDTTAALIDYFPGNTATLGGQLSTLTLTAVQADALLAAGVNRVVPMHATRVALEAANGTPTFNPYVAGSVPLATGLVLARVDELAVEGDEGVVSDDPTLTGDIYVMFGFGKRCSMVGKVTTEPPTHFGENAESNAARVYGRVCLIYRIARGNGTATPTPLERAVFVGAVALHDDGIANGGAHIEEYYNITRAQ
jgi:hypothetical protein